MMRNTSKTSKDATAVGFLGPHGSRGVQFDSDSAEFGGSNSFNEQNSSTISSDIKCGDMQPIAREFRQHYEKKLKEAAADNSGDGVQVKMKLQEDWIRDLTEQNDMLIRAVLELETEATERVKMLEEKLKESAACACEAREAANMKHKEILEIQQNALIFGEGSLDESDQFRQMKENYSTLKQETSAIIAHLIMENERMRSGLNAINDLLNWKPTKRELPQLYPTRQLASTSTTTDSKLFSNSETIKYHETEATINYTCSCDLDLIEDDSSEAVVTKDHLLICNSSCSDLLPTTKTVDTSKNNNALINKTVKATLRETQSVPNHYNCTANLNKTDHTRYQILKDECKFGDSQEEIYYLLTSLQDKDRYILDQNELISMLIQKLIIIYDALKSFEARLNEKFKNIYDTNGEPPEMILQQLIMLVKTVHEDINHFTQLLQHERTLKLIN